MWCRSKRKLRNRKPRRSTTKRRKRIKRRKSRQGIQRMKPKFVLMLSALLCFAAAEPVAAAEPYRFIKEIPAGGDGGWDYLSVDSAARRLYVSHAQKVVVIDL